MYAVVWDAGTYNTPEQAREAAAEMLREAGSHMEPFLHVVKVEFLPPTPEEEAHAINDAMNEREARQWEAQRRYENALRFQL